MRWKIILSIFLALGLARSAVAQSPCTEAGDAPYFDRMGQAREAIEAERYDEALVHLQWARERYTFALLRYSEARALQHLGRYLEAVDAYEAFIRTGLPCTDFDNLRARARAYRDELLEVLREDAQADERAEADQASAETGGDSLGDEPPGDDEAPTRVDDSQAQDETAEAGAEVPAESGSEASSDEGWILLGVGGALLTAAIIYDLAVVPQIREDKSTAVAELDRVAFDLAEADMQQAQVIDVVLYSASGLAVLAGTLLLSAATGEGDGPRASLALAPGSLSLGVGWVF
jgi:tetratricopeptide (TPR) repeat protein